MNFFVYILYSEKANKYYVGHTSDVQKRFWEHNNPGTTTKFTAKYLPWKLMAHFFVSETRADALAVERFIKNQKSRKFLSKIIQNNSDKFFIAEIIKMANKKTK